MAGLISQADRSSTRAPRVELRGISKRFGGAYALEDVSLEIEPGSVHALVGENGAGKSTLGKIIAGSIQPDAGTILLDGAHVSLHSPREALGRGIAAIAQELMIVSRLSVAQNVFLGQEPHRGGWLSRRELRRRYQRLAQNAGFTLAADRPVGGMRVAEQQQVEIMRALARDARMIVMDEPSASLSGPDVERLHEIIRALAGAGKTVLLVSHFLGEVLELADEVTVLRDGRLVRTASAAQETEETLIQGMLGHALGSAYPRKRPPAPDAPVVLSVRDVRAPGVGGVSLQVRAGEILGLAGLVGAGRTELARAVFGADGRSSGKVEVDGRPLPSGHLRAALRHGVAMIPESRRDQGLILGRSAVENAALSSLADRSRGGFVRRRSERRAVADVLDTVALAGNRDAPVLMLSGGNQQKTLFARALMRPPRVLIADEPTRGVDVGAKRAIYELMADLAASGTAILLISSELAEIIGVAHRVLVMRLGTVVKELSEAELSESAILAAAFSGGEQTERAA